MEKQQETIKEYNEDSQFALLQFLVSSQNLFSRCRQIVHPAYFDHKYRQTVRFVLDYADEFNALPNEIQIKSQTGMEVPKVDSVELEEKHSDWFLQEMETFCRHRALENIIESSPEMIQKGYYNKVESQIREAVLISLQKDLGIDYFQDLDGIVKRLQDNNAVTSSGWDEIDKKLGGYNTANGVKGGGFNRGELNIVAAASGQGKSLFLQNLALNWVQQGLSVVYITLELSEELIGMRLHAMLSGMSTGDVHKNKDKAVINISQGKRKNKWGELKLKFMKIGTTANDIKAYLKEFEIQTGKAPDAILVDYLDLLHPNSLRVSPSDLFVKDKYVAEELRSLVQEQQLLMCTASQLGRAAVEEHDHDMHHIAGGISKINTADNVFTLYASQVMKERGEYCVQFIKTRSSAGVGQRIYLDFDNTNMRMTNQDEAKAAAHESAMPSQASQTADSLRRRATTEESSTNSPAPTALSEQGASLRTLLDKNKRASIRD